jgi:hypothetical protein
MANILFPVVGPLILWDIGASHRNDQPGVPPEYHEWARLTPPRVVEHASGRGKIFRLLVVLLFLIGVVVVVFLVLPHLAG